MSDWTTKTVQHGACTVIIHRPVLTEQDRAKQERQAQDTLSHVMCDYIKRKGENHGSERNCEQGSGGPEGSKSRLGAS